MYSTSSSECECDKYCTSAYGAPVYENQDNSYGRTPFYPTMGHPLIYYAQVVRQERIGDVLEKAKAGLLNKVQVKNIIIILPEIHHFLYLLSCAIWPWLRELPLTDERV